MSRALVAGSHPAGGDEPGPQSADKMKAGVEGAPDQGNGSIIEMVSLVFSLWELI